MAGSHDDLRFRPKLGRTRPQRRRPFAVIQVKRAMAKAGVEAKRTQPPGRDPGTRIGSLPAKRGRGAVFVRVRAAVPRGWSHARPGARRVVVKARYVPMRAGSRAASVHLRYLQRDGVTRDGAPGRLYSATEDQADGRAFLERSEGDPRQFRFIVAPEDAAELADLRAYTRDLMRQVEDDLGTTLDWVAVDHFNTGHPHSHVVIRGLDDRGKNLVIAGAYLAHGVRERASEIATLELGPETEWERQRKLRNEVGQERLTRIDRALLREVGDSPGGIIDLRPEAGAHVSDLDRQLRVGRLRTLERLGLATEIEVGQWQVSPDMEGTLRDLGERGDIIKTMHRALSRGGAERGAEQFAIHGARERIEAPIIGRLVGRGLAGDELGDRVHLVVDGLDGRAHYLELAAEVAGIEAAPLGSLVEVGPAREGPRAADRTVARLASEGDGIYRPSAHLREARADPRIPDPDAHVEAHVRRLEALRRAGIAERLDADRWRVPDDFVQRAAGYDARRGPAANFRVLSALGLEAQVASDGATWLDRQLVGRERVQVMQAGFGLEVEAALERRQAHHVEHGDARRDASGRMLYRRDLLATLERRELARVGAELAAGREVAFRMAEPGEAVSGTYREPVQLASGRYALVENAGEFTLVPWRPVIERELGREVAGQVTDGGVSWRFGRDLGLAV